LSSSCLLVVYVGATHVIRPKSGFELSGCVKGRNYLTSWAAVSFSRTASYNLISLVGSPFPFLRLSIVLISLG
jgi:hypothetical protein